LRANIVRDVSCCAAARAALVALVVPAVIWDADHRGLHDKATGTIVLNH